MAVRWQRLPLLGLLWPLLWLQARHVRRFAPHLPEPPGRRAGTAGRGSLIRLLVAGDSGAAGVGAPTQGQALCGHLVRRLSRHHTVQWCVLAANGLDSPGLLELLQDAPRERFDVVVLSMGANDATRLCAPQQWGRWQTRLAELIDLRFTPALLVHSAVPPMHWHPETTTLAGMAVDGIHPSAQGYADWAEGLSRCILDAQAPGAGLTARS